MFACVGEKKKKRKLKREGVGGRMKEKGRETEKETGFISQTVYLYYCLI